MFIRRYLCTLVATLTLAPAGVVCAQAFSISVEQTGCQGVDPRRVEQIVGLEIESTFGTPKHGLSLSAEIVCHAEGVEISVDGPPTGKRVGRTLPPLTHDEEDAERAIALATAQLFLASWLDLLVVEKQSSAPRDGPAKAAEDSRVATGKTVERHRRSGEIAIEVGARLLALGELLPATRVGLWGGGEIAQGFSLFGLAAFERGRAFRDQGKADVYAGWAGIGAAHRWPFSRFLSGELGVITSGGYVLLKGDATGQRRRTGEVGGMTGEITLFAGPVFYFGSVMLAVDFRGGYTLQNPIGTVEGNDDVSIGGFWIGGILRIGLRLG